VERDGFGTSIPVIGTQLIYEDKMRKQWKINLLTQLLPFRILC